MEDVRHPMARASRLVFLLAPLLAACGGSGGLTPPRDGGAPGRSADAPDAGKESDSPVDTGAEAPSDAPATSDAPAASDVGPWSIDGPRESAGADGRIADAADDGGADADAGTCAFLTFQLSWNLVAPGGGAETCNQAGATAVYIIVDATTYKFDCAAGTGTVPGLAPGAHKVVVEVHGGGAPPTPTGARNPASCVNDIDCVATPACGGDICSYYSGIPTCQPAGQQPAGSDGWCTTDADCKCHAQGARCNGIFCSFTKQPDVVLTRGELSEMEFGCGLINLGHVQLLL
jgi:hypothetical protein